MATPYPSPSVPESEMTGSEQRSTTAGLVGHQESPRTLCPFTPLKLIWRFQKSRLNSQWNQWNYSYLKYLGAFFGTKVGICY